MDVYLLSQLHYCQRAIGLMSSVFANGLGDQGSIPGRVRPKTQKMVLDATLLITQHYKVKIKGKVEQSREWSSTLPYTAVLKLLKRKPSGHPLLRSPTLLLSCWYTCYYIIQYSIYYNFSVFCQNINLLTESFKIISSKATETIKK